MTRCSSHSFCCNKSTYYRKTVITTYNFAVGLRVHAKLHFSPCPMFLSSLGYFLRDLRRFSPFSHLSVKLVWFHPRRWGGDEGNARVVRWAVRTRPNVISISCLRTRVGLHISDTVGGPTTNGARRMHSPRDAFFMATTWGRVGKRWSPAASGLSTADGWTPAWLVSAVSARRDSADEQIFYKRTGNWHGPDSHFRGSAGISRRRLIVTRATDFTTMNFSALASVLWMLDIISNVLEITVLCLCRNLDARQKEYCLIFFFILLNYFFVLQLFYTLFYIRLNCMMFLINFFYFSSYTCLVYCTLET